MIFIRVCLVGKKRNGAKMIVWSGVLKFALSTMLLGALLASVVYLAVTGRWNREAPIAGALAGLATTVIATLINFMTPRNRLPVIGG